MAIILASNIYRLPVKPQPCSWAHDAFDASPLEVYDCYAAGEDNQRFELDQDLGTIRTRQAGPTSEAFVVSACGGHFEAS